MPLDRRRLLHLAAAGGLALAGCSSNEGNRQSETPTATRTTTATASGTQGASATPTRVITMSGSTFGTVRASVDPGTTVTWRNQDGVPHTVTSAQFHDSAAAWSFDERAAADERISYTFEDPGVYEYYCTIHGRGTMCGVVLVGDATLSASLPCENDGDQVGY